MGPSFLFIMDNQALQERFSIYERTMQNDAVAYPVNLAFKCAKEYFGEERVMLKVACPTNKRAEENISSIRNYCWNINDIPWTRQTITIHYPKVTVTNELHNSTEIYDLFVLLQFREDGTFQDIHYLKTTFTSSQWESGYIHSHTPSLHDSEIFWGHVCLGTGPINGTINQLRRGEQYSEFTWELFFWELDKMVQTESLEGGPYMRMEHIVNNLKQVNPQNFFCTASFASEFSTDFIESYIKSKRLKLVFRNGKFCLGTSFLEWYLDFNAYRNAYCKILNLTDNIRKQDYYYNDAALYVKTRTRLYNSRQAPSENPILEFNGVVYKLKIIQEEEKLGLRKIYGISLPVAKRFLDVLICTYNNAITFDND